MSETADSGTGTDRYAHRRRPVRGRDPRERGRAASPLELIYDLTFAVSIGVGASNFADVTAAGHLTEGLIGFGFAMFAVIWAWINFSWFASAFDTDDWLYRLLTMVQMVGVVVLALGIPAAFGSIEEGDHFDNKVMVLGYVVMRVGLLGHWLRAAHGCTGALRATALRYAAGLLVMQLAWCVFAFVPMSLHTALLVSLPLFAAELLLPAVAERTGNTPWHAHHIAERYSLFAIIAMGEGVVGTAASSGDLMGSHGWTADTITVVVAGIGLTVGMWWVYFIVPFADVLHRRRDASFVFGYGHMLLFAGIAGTGAGLHIAGLYIEGDTRMSQVTAVGILAGAVALFLVCVFVVFDGTAGRLDPVHLPMLVGSLLPLVAAVVVAAAGVDIAVSLALVTLAPWVDVLIYELFAHRHVPMMVEGDHEGADAAEQETRR